MKRSNIGGVSILVFFVLWCVSFYNLPYLTLVITLAILVVFNEMTTDVLLKKYFLVVFFIISFICSCIPFATKTLTPIMNDKGFYYGYMLDVINQSYTKWYEYFNGNDILSYLLLKISAGIFGVGDSAFAFFYFISFLILFISLVKIARYNAMLCIYLFMSQYNFEGLYGNVIRQGLGLSLFMLAISNNGNKKYLYGVMSALAHFSFFICLPFYFIAGKIKKITTRNMFVLLAGCYFIGGVVLKYLISYAGTLSSYVSTRADAYQDGDFGNSIIRKVVMTSIFIVISELIYIRLCKEKKINDLHLKVRSYFILMCSVFFLTISFQEIANRYAFNIMAFVFIFVSFYVAEIRNKDSKISLALLLTFLGFPLYIYINIVGVQYFYYGDLKSILTDNISDVLLKL